MRFFTVLLIGFLGVANLSTGWENDFDSARQKASREHKLILLNFSGSDWCIPCIRLHKNIFESESFTRYADENLVLINADFPRLKKNQLSRDQQHKNDELASKYNEKGIFPYTLLLDANGKVLHTWEGLPNQSAEEFTTALKDLVNEGH